MDGMKYQQIGKLIKRDGCMIWEVINGEQWAGPRDALYAWRVCPNARGRMKCCACWAWRMSRKT